MGQQQEESKFYWHWFIAFVLFKIELTFNFKTALSYLNANLDCVGEALCRALPNDGQDSFEVGLVQFLLQNDQVLIKVIDQGLRIASWDWKNISSALKKTDDIKNRLKWPFVSWKSIRLQLWRL